MSQMLRRYSVRVLLTLQSRQGIEAFRILPRLDWLKSKALLN